MTEKKLIAEASSTCWLTTTSTWTAAQWCPRAPIWWKGKFWKFWKTQIWKFQRNFNLKLFCTNTKVFPKVVQCSLAQIEKFKFSQRLLTNTKVLHFLIITNLKVLKKVFPKAAHLQKHGSQCPPYLLPTCIWLLVNINFILLEFLLLICCSLYLLLWIQRFVVVHPITSKTSSQWGNQIYE